MHPLVTWAADHLDAVLVGGLVIATGMLLVGAVATWRTGKRLRTPPRRPVRFVLSLALLVAGAGAIALLGTGLARIVPGVWAQRAMLGEPAPELGFALVESDLVGSLADFRGRVVLVNVWATWCPPCRHEMPDLDRLQRTYAGEGLVVLHLSDEDRQTLVAWLEERPTAAVHAYSQPIPWPEFGRPTTYVVDREGTLQRVLVGQRSYEQFEREIRRYL